MSQTPFITINLQQQTALLKSTSSKKYQVLILLMLDCGLRVSEVIQLQCKHVVFAENKIKIIAAKKSREIPLTQRLLKALADYFQQLKNFNPDDYLFPAGKNSKIVHIGRKQIWKLINQLSKGTINPTLLRNTFANRIVQDKQNSHLGIRGDYTKSHHRQNCYHRFIWFISE